MQDTRILRLQLNDWQYRSKSYVLPKGKIQQIIRGRKGKVMASQLQEVEERSEHPLNSRVSKQTKMDSTDIHAR